MGRWADRMSDRVVLTPLQTAHPGDRETNFHGIGDELRFAVTDTYFLSLSPTARVRVRV